MSVYVSKTANAMQRLLEAGSKTAAERDRLKALNAELLAACKDMVQEFDIAHLESVFDGQITAWQRACTAITNAEKKL